MPQLIRCALLPIFLLNSLAAVKKALVLVEDHVLSSTSLNANHFRCKIEGPQPHPCGDIFITISWAVDCGISPTLVAAMFRIVLIDKRVNPRLLVAFATLHWLYGFDVFTASPVVGVPWMVMPHPKDPRSFLATLVHWTPGDYEVMVRQLPYRHMPSCLPQVLFNDELVPPGSDMNITLHRKIALVMSGGGSFGAFQV